MSSIRKAAFLDVEAAAPIAPQRPLNMWETREKTLYPHVDAAAVAAAKADQKQDVAKKLKERNQMEIKILGTGCKSCKNLEINTIKAIEEMGISASIEKVENLMDIMSYNVMRTPALVVDEKVKIMGRVPNVEEIKKYLK
jgi:small redox-active disulfide protein 2